MLCFFILNISQLGLFRLLPKLEITNHFKETKVPEKLEDGSLTFPYSIPSAIITMTVDVINELNLNPIFDWKNWREGQFILDNKDFDYSKLEPVTLCKLLTVMTRMDRVNEGYLISCFEKGIVTKIIRGLQHTKMDNAFDQS